MALLRIWLLTIAVCLSCSLPLRAAEQSITLFMTDIPAQSMEDAGSAGIALELVREASIRAGYHQYEEFLPWLRAVDGAETAARGFIIPFSRTPGRQKRFQWVVELYDLQFGFVSNTAHVNSWDTARSLDAVGVWRGSSMQEDLEKRGFNNLYVLSDDKALNRLMVHKRIDAWYGALIEAAWKFRSLTLEQHADLHFGKPVISYPVWLATGKMTESAVIKAYRQAFRDMQVDGTHRRILDKYGVYSGPGS